MRTVSGVLLSSAAAVGLLAFMPARAAAPVTMEKSLLGVRILQTYKDVLGKLGQPRLIVRGGERFVYDPVLDPAGNDLGGIRSISYEGGSGGSGGGAPGGGPGAPSSAGGMLSPGGMMGSKKGDMGGGGASPGGGGGSLGGASSDGADTTFGQAGGYAWFYHDARKQVAYSFLFNLEGRVLGIMERGRDGGMPTQRGIHLGSTIKQLYEVYGWPDTIQDNEPGFILDYGTKYHAKFAVIKDHVVGIGVVLEESLRVPFFPETGSAGGGPGGGGKGGGAGAAPRGPGGGGGGGGKSSAD